MKPISLQEYAKRLGLKDENINSLSAIQEYVEEYHDCTLWDYPLEELEYCKEEDKNVILVETDFGLRLCEI
jgi:membrane-anchored protein YejM (alkaline phosphatase superfamily)